MDREMASPRYALIGAAGTLITAAANDVVSLLLGVCSLIIVAPKAISVLRALTRKKTRPPSNESADKL